MRKQPNFKRFHSAFNSLSPFFIICLLGYLSCNSGNAQDLALHKPYRLSALPNYSYTALPSDTTSLTDGIYTRGYFWRARTTVGWNSKPSVTITIDLEEIQPIGTVSFNTARRLEAGVKLPKDIFVFTSVDDKSYCYTGDMIDKSQEDETLPKYEVKKISLKNINVRARYVLLVVIPGGNSVFCDEIEVDRGRGNLSKLNKLIPKNRIGTSVDSIESNSYNKESLVKQLKSVEENSNWERVYKESVNSILRTVYNNSDGSPKELKIAKKRLYEVNAFRLQKNYNTSYIVQKVNPWDSVTSLHQPNENPSTANYDFTVLKQGVEFGAFLVTNVMSTEQAFSFSITSSSNNLVVSLYSVPFVPTLNFAEVADPLVPVNKNQYVGPGSSQLFLFKITGLQPGKVVSRIVVQGKDKIFDITISTSVLHFDAYTNDGLNADNWAYLDYPMISDRREDVINDLAIHHINTIVVLPKYIPLPGGDNDFSRLTNYISQFKRVKNILVATSFNKVESTDANYKNVPYLSDRWKEDFQDWYRNLLSSIGRIRTDFNVYLYPYDEVSDPTDIHNFINLVNWGKKTIPGFKVYGTLASTIAVANMAPLIDISQLLGFNLIQHLPKEHGEIWTYDVKDSSRNLPPYQYYRLMSWKAFYYDMEGVGFWNYSDVDKEYIPDSYSFTKIPFKNYSVIYDGLDNHLISTRRWEAFSLGIEDYTILKMYLKKFGIGRTKALVKQVILNPGNLNEADIIRSQMLLQL